MYQKVLQYALNCSPALVGLGTLFSSRRKYGASHLQFSGFPNHDELLPLSRFAVQLPNASSRHYYLYDLHLCDQLAVDFRDLAERRRPLNDGRIFVSRDPRLLACILLCAARDLITRFFRCAYGALNFVAEYPTSLNGSCRSCLLNTVRLYRESTSSFLLLRVP